MSMFTDKQGKLQPIWAFVFSLMLSALAFFVSGNIGHEAADQKPFRSEFFFRILWMLLLFGIYVWMLTVADHVEEHRIAAQGLPRSRGWLKQFMVGCVLGCGLTLLAIAPIHFWGRLRTHHFLIRWQLLPNLGAVFLMLLCGALAEELVFRGYPFQHLERAIGSVRAVLVFSVLYGLLHLVNPYANRWGVANSVLIGILLSLAYLRTRALWLPWGIHFAWNATLGLLFGLPVSGIRVVNLWTYTVAFGPKWLTGGEYGVEASATGAAVIVLGILLVWKLPFSKLPQPGRRMAAEAAVQDPVSTIKR
jgi:uncharacterized protein